MYSEWYTFLYNIAKKNRFFVFNGITYNVNILLFVAGDLCRPLNCKKRELCLLEDAYTAVCVSKKELHRNRWGENRDKFWEFSSFQYFFAAFLLFSLFSCSIFSRKFSHIIFIWKFSNVSYITTTTFIYRTSVLYTSCLKILLLKRPL